MLTFIRNLRSKLTMYHLKKEGLKIGEECEIYRGVSFGSEPYLIEIGNHVRITTGCKLITHDGGVWVLRQLKENEDFDLFGKIKIGNNVHIGMDSIIMPNVRIGDNCIIGCGSIVTKNVPDNEVWAGVPAHKIKTIEDYHLKHTDEFEFTKCFKSMEKKKYLISKYKDLC